MSKAVRGPVDSRGKSLRSGIKGRPAGAKSKSKPGVRANPHHARGNESEAGLNRDATPGVENATGAVPGDVIGGDRGVGGAGGSGAGGTGSGANGDRPGVVSAPSFGGGKSKTRTSKKASLDLDADDLAGLIQTGYALAANGTKFPGFEIESDEAHLISEPLARILARHPEWAETVAKVSDPAALIVACFTVTAPRIAAYQAYRQLLRIELEKQRNAPPQPPSGANGPARENPPPKPGVQNSGIDIPPGPWQRGF